MEIIAYHKRLETLHVGCEKPRAYFIPYENEEKALTGNREDSSLFFLLNGKWSFRWYKSFEDIEEDFLDADFTDTISVPGCWQLELGKGYDVPLYSNLRYPFPTDPPHVPLDNPAGHYSREFDVSLKQGKKYYLNFEGVSSCFYLYINGGFAGYSQVSHCTSEFDISDYLLDGKNRIDVVVVKWCDGSYLEDQDMFRLSGIFRDVYILERSENAVKDIEISFSVSDDLSNCRVYSATEFPIGSEFVLYDASGIRIAVSDKPDFLIDNVVLWNTEAPYLYKLIVKSEGEFIPFNLAIKKLEFIRNIAYFNGKPIKLLGVNRHDINPDTGYYVTRENMIEDLQILKRANVNTIRTSHYPNSPLFLELCDRFGFMLVDEADIETHGMGFEYKDTWDWMRWSKLSTDDEWEEAYVDRAQRLYERDKNFGCVIMWSLGNESGCGKNHRAMRRYIKSRNPDAIVHYENSHLEFKAVPIGENFSDISDVESRMYSSLDYTEAYAANKSSAKPFFFCEFSCSMSSGDIHKHADLIRKYPAIFGGCFWEFSDHAIRDINGGLRYGGDFGDYPNDNTCCIDGAVFADRRLRPGYDDLKIAYEPFECSLDNDKLVFFNRNYFTKLTGCVAEICLEIEGETVDKAEFDVSVIEPQSSAAFVLPFSNPGKYNAFITVYVRCMNKTEWSDAGYMIGFSQFEISETPEISAPVLSVPDYSVSRRYITVSCKNSVYTYDKAYGKISRAEIDGRNVLSSPAGIEIWKAPGYNEKERAFDCRSAAMECSEMNVISSEIIEEKDCLKIVNIVTIGGPSVVPVLKGALSYRFSFEGRVDISFTGSLNDKLEGMNLRLPRFGFVFDVLPEFNNMEYFGKGPGECYAERHLAQRYGKYKSNADDNFVHYVRPIENGAHFGTRWGKIFSSECGFEFRPLTEDSLLFNATRFGPHTLEKYVHDDELIPDDCVHVYLDYKMDIRGGRGIYEELEPERIWNHEDFTFGICIAPFLIDN